MPSSNRGAPLKVVRYENLPDHQIHRAIAELRLLRAVPYADTNQKNVLAKRTHLKSMPEIRKCECDRQKV